jgi:hypothetical protein
VISPSPSLLHLWTLSFRAVLDLQLCNTLGEVCQKWVFAPQKIVSLWSWAGRGSRAEG